MGRGAGWRSRLRLPGPDGRKRSGGRCDAWPRRWVGTARRASMGRGAGYLRPAFQRRQPGKRPAERLKEAGRVQLIQDGKRKEIYINPAFAMTATPATQEADNPATVAVAGQPEPPPKLTPGEVSNIRAWLAHIEETDSAIIAEVVVDKCRNNQEAHRYFLKRSEEVPELTRVNRSVHCGDYIHFERIDHPRLGHCAKGEPEAIAGMWDTDRRYCERFLPRPQQTHNDQPRPTRTET